MVQHVKRFEPKLHPMWSGERDHLAHSDVDGPKRRVVQSVPRLDSKRAGSRSRERILIEPDDASGEVARGCDVRIGNLIPELCAASWPDTSEVVAAAD